MLPLAQAIFVVGGLMVLLLCGSFAFRYRSSFFRYFTAGFACTFAVVLTETAGPQVADLPGWAAFVAVMLVAASVCLLRSANRLTTVRDQPWQLPGALALALAIGGLTLLGAPSRWVVMVGGLCFTLAATWLGWAFLKLEPAGAPGGFRWVGAALIGLAWWPIIVPYPLVQGTSLAWIGFLGSGILQVIVGGGMLAYLLDDAWHRFREEQARTDRLKSEFVSMVSHELRTPLTSIIGYTEFLEDGLEGPLGTGQLAYVHEIQANSRKLQRLVDDLLDFPAREGQALSLHLADTDLRERVRQVLASLTPQAARAGVTLQAELPSDAVMWGVDPDRIDQVLTNLVGNALKFTPVGGQVTVTLAVHPDEAAVEVADTGIGIPPEALQHVFEKFYQIDGALTRNREGAGLGLAIARAIAEAHGGWLTAESQPGKGSVFRLTLPLHRAT